MARMPRLDALLLLLALGRAHARPTHAQLQAHLLAGYSTADVPNTNRSSRCADLGHLAPDSCATFELGTDVAIEFQFYKLESVDLAKGIMLLRSWLRLTWTDPRLAWNTTEWEHTSTNIPISKLWKPDVSVYNAVTHLQASFTDEDAIVYPSGFVFWSRPGNLQVLCRFSGLVNFPHDRLQCQFDVAAWVLPASSQGLYPKGLVGYKLPEVLASGPISLQSALSSYQAQSITNVSVHYAENTYPSEPNDPYPTLTYTVTLDRNTFFFLNFALLPNVFFSLISIGIMFFHVAPNVEGRISLLLTNLLLVVVEKQTVRAYLPICGELLWIEMFFWLNFCVTMLVLLESMVVHGISSLSCQDLWGAVLPDPLSTWARKGWQKLSGATQAEADRSGHVLASGSPLLHTDAAGQAHGQNSATRLSLGLRRRDLKLVRAPRTPKISHVAGMEYDELFVRLLPAGKDEVERDEFDRLLRFVRTGRTRAGGGEPSQPESGRTMNQNEFIGLCKRELGPQAPEGLKSKYEAYVSHTNWLKANNYQTFLRQFLKQRGSWATSQAFWEEVGRLDGDARLETAEDVDHRRARWRLLRFFESMFYTIDADGNGIVTCDEAQTMLLFCAKGINEEQAKLWAYEADTSNREGLDSREFVNLCKQRLTSEWQADVKLPEAASKDKSEGDDGERERELEELQERWAQFTAYRDALYARVQAVWVHRAIQVDRWFRTYLPLMYVVGMVVLYAMHIDDGYTSVSRITMSRFFDEMTVSLTTNMIELRQLVWWLMMIVLVFGSLFAIMMLFWLIVAKSISAYLRAIAYRRSAYDVYNKKVMLTVPARMESASSGFSLGHENRKPEIQPAASEMVKDVPLRPAQEV